MQLRIADDILAEYPDLTLGIAVAHGLDNGTDHAEIAGLLRAAEAGLPAKLGGTPPAEHPHIAPWRAAYQKFGAKPKQYPSSIENLAGRVLRGTAFPHINNLVSIYNVVSLRYVLPVGGEDLAAVQGDIVLRHAGEAEPAVFLLGEKDARPPKPGEIIYTDDRGAICRRWNWKEADRTKLTHATRAAVLVIEALPPAPREAVAAALKDLAELVQQYCGGTVRRALLDRAQPAVALDA